MASSSAGSSIHRPSPVPSRPSSVGGDGSSESQNGIVAEKSSDDSSKLRTFLGILRKFVGVADIASVRFSLPAQLLEPTPNLEYWTYLDRPEFFVSMGDSDDELDRMLSVLRFWFTKDLKYVKGKPCKPYNSVLGEFFRCNWTVDTPSTPILARTTAPKTPNEPSKPLKVSFLTEQTSHHPPVSAFYVDCPEKGITARGFDQISAKFTGTTVKVGPGAHNLGIFVTLHNRGDEQYQLTHPTAHLGGLLRGTLSISVADVCYVTCPKTKLKVILQYLEEGWIGKAQNKMEGIVFRYDPENDTKTRIKDVPEKDILVKIDGCWHKQIYFTLTSTKERQLLLDLEPLFPLAKIVPPEEEQLPNESRKFWGELTRAILNKEYSRANTVKHELEERQREKAAERKNLQQEWQPRFFTGAVTPIGRPALTEDGQKALRGLHEGLYHLEPPTVYGA